jgi:hypothetical protein
MMMLHRQTQNLRGSRPGLKPAARAVQARLTTRLVRLGTVQSRLTTRQLCLRTAQMDQQTDSQIGSPAK